MHARSLRRLFSAAAIAAATASFAFAQSSPTQSSAGTTLENPDATVSAQGCLMRERGPSGERRFALYDVSTADPVANQHWYEFQLEPRTQSVPLGDHVGHKVEVIGRVTSPASEGTSGPAVMVVSEVRRVASECESGQ